MTNNYLQEAPAMKKTVFGFLASLFLVALGVFFYFFENICFISTSKKVVGPFTALHPEPTSYCIPISWAYILTAMGVVLFLISIYFNHKNPHTR